MVFFHFSLLTWLNLNYYFIISWGNQNYSIHLLILKKKKLVNHNCLIQYKRSMWYNLLLKHIIRLTKLICKQVIHTHKKIKYTMLNIKILRLYCGSEDYFRKENASLVNLVSFTIYPEHMGKIKTRLWFAIFKNISKKKNPLTRHW